MKASELREMTIEELERKHQELREEHFKLRFQAASGQSEKPHLIGYARRDIARVLTVIRERRGE
ncbi:MAG: 50S ribosomal protein L29 [Candidatus Auribacterota bacterium]|nr:50S ribosomal protein L29 [Candidatus Auribacterota bacterium]